MYFQLTYLSDRNVRLPIGCETSQQSVAESLKRHCELQGEDPQRLTIMVSNAERSIYMPVNNLQQAALL